MFREETPISTLPATKVGLIVSSRTGTANAATIGIVRRGSNMGKHFDRESIMFP